MDIGVSGLLETGDGNLNGWGFSIDTFKIEIVQNDFISGGLYGGINPPITGDGDYLNYKAILTKEENNQFEFTAIALPDSLNFSSHFSGKGCPLSQFLCTVYYG